MAIYTRRGDAGTTRIYGTRTPLAKTDCRIAALGSVDELNAHLGLLLAYITNRGIRNQLTTLQRDFFEIGAEIASASSRVSPYTIRKSKINRLERWIDVYWNKLPPLTNFIFPGGSLASAQTHVVRTVCRRAELSLVAFSQATSVNPLLLSYINRLSDYFLALARWINYNEGIGDMPWVSAKGEKGKK